ncbi:hypothetical protein [Streptomyces viridochromogenes]|uniref:hypothetical protein n=1 Tax=Streptomyces viridochromogenes TaxID=1938 RepID=UPI00069E301E|nr:hypothetical protein [Streptomyces viridochromogenes]KOG17526.1 hypothetical protein ADK36_24225 [Streptomyces viridochromogenes]KOG25724.1 hypothetical protein ADK35_08240 [Streptomyces viridochromogenes]
MFLLILLFVVVAVIVAVGLCGYGGRTLADHGLRRASAPAVLRGLAALAGAGACALYAWGLLTVCGAVMTAEDGGTDSSPPRSCRTAGWSERHQRGIEIVDYEVTYLPLGFVCETSDGGSYDNGDVPGYVNPAVFGLALAAAGGGIGSAYMTELRARAEFRRQQAG